MATNVDQCAANLHQALLQNQVYTKPSDTDSELDMATAYAIQKALVQMHLAGSDAKIGGYKAALTAKPAQESMGIDAPVVGVLWHSGRRQPGCTTGANEISNLLLETELGFALTAAVTAPIADVDALKAITASVRPMVELACMGFGGAKPRGVDLVASNSASKGYIAGTEIPNWSAQDLNQIQVQLTRGEETVHSSNSGSVMGDQWQALLWLVNTVVDQGYRIEPEHVLMTGSIGGIHPGLSGAYRATYSSTTKLEQQPLGQIDFTVT